MVILQWVSTFVLALIASMGVNYAMFRRRRVGWFIALAFAFYFLAAVFDLKPEKLPSALPPVFFFLASLVMLWAVVSLILERPNAQKPMDAGARAADPSNPSGPQDPVAPPQAPSGPGGAGER
jgi:hypothetical protein